LPYPEPYAILLTAAFIAVVALLAGGLALGRYDTDKTCRLPRPLRIALSGTLLVAAMAQWHIAPPTAFVRIYALRLAMGMAAAFLGDLIMARLVPVPNRLIFGMVAFSACHLAYTSGFLAVAGWLGVASPLAQRAVAVVLVGCALAWWRWVFRPAGKTAVNVGSLIYGLLVGTMVGVALQLASHSGALLGLAAGALSFLISDFVLGNWVVRGHKWQSVNDVVWGTYVGGQLLIVYSVASVWRLTI